MDSGWNPRFDIDAPEVIESMQDPQDIYHYTTPEGFYNIIESGRELWASEHRFLNDAGEVQHGVDEVCDLISEGIRGLREDVAELVINSLKKEPALPQYIACFSDSEALLPQWRAYSDNARGYCLCFRVERLYGPFDKDGNRHSFELLKCEYGIASFRKAVSSRIEEIVQRWNEYAAGKNLDASDIAEILVPLALRNAVRLKHVHFESERESRLWVDGPDNALRYRMSQRGPVTYRHSAPLDLKGAWVGPAAKPTAALAREWAEGFLRSKGLNVPVRIWETPYRA